MLGYDVEFGHKQAMDLLAAPGYAEKHVGYMACSIFLNEKDELLRLVTNSVRNDLTSRNEAFQSLALNFAANVGGEEFSQLLTTDVMHVLQNGATRPAIRKKAALCLLRLLRKSSPDSEIFNSDTWGPQLAFLLEDNDIGVLLGLCTLLLGVIARGSFEGYEPCVPKLVAIMERMRNREVTQDYTYYGLASPWLQVKCLRALQYFPPPTDPHVLKSLTETLKRILGGSEPVKNQNKNNAVNAIVFEAVSVAIGLEEPGLLSIAVALLAKFLKTPEANLRYLALENIGRLAEVPAVAEALATHQSTITACLKDPDVSIRRRALDVLFACAGPTNAVSTVEHLLSALKLSDYAMREDIVLKAAVLAERFLPSLEWYIDSMLTLMENAGEAAINDVWQSVVQLVTNAPTLHTYAARRVVQALQTRNGGGETFLRAASHILGEYGNLIVAEVPLYEQFKLLQVSFSAVHAETKAMMLTAFGKMALVDPSDAKLGREIDAILERYRGYLDPELQQRAVEYKALSSMANRSVALAALQPLPKWEKKGSLLLRRLAQKVYEEGDEAREVPSWLLQLQQEQVIMSERPSEQQVVEVVSSGGEIPSIMESTRPVMDLMDLLDLTEETPAQQGSVLHGVDHAYPASHGGVEGEVADQDKPSPTASVGSVRTEGVAVEPVLRTTPSSVPPTPTVNPTVDVSMCVRKLYTADSSVLYEDPYLQVGVKASYEGSTGRIVIYLGNKHTEPLENLVCKLASKMTAGLQLSLVATPPASLSPKQQVQVPLSVVLLSGDVDASPSLHLHYTVGKELEMNRILELPVPVTKFIQPIDVPVTVFKTRWGQVHGAPYKLEGRLSWTGEIAPKLESLGIKLIETSEEGVVSGACVLPCGQPSKQIPVMVKVHGNGVVEVATTDPGTSKGMLIALVHIFG